MEEIFYDRFSYLIVVGFVLQMICSLLHARGNDSMLLRLLSKWASLFAFTGICAMLLVFLMQPRSFWIFFLIGFIIVVFLDTLWTRLGVALFSMAMPRRFLRPYEVLSAWRPGKKFWNLKREIESLGFSQKLSLRSDIPDSDLLRTLSTIFVSKDSTVMLCVNFAMAASEMQMSLALLSKTCEGKTFFTTNQCSPDGLAYPANYDFAYKPWTRGFSKLLSIHKKRLKKRGATPAPLPEPTIAKLWEDSLAIERENFAEGLLTPLSEIDESGILTADGKYKLWVESLIFNYFGVISK